MTITDCIFFRLLNLLGVESAFPFLNLRSLIPHGALLVNVSCVPVSERAFNLLFFKYEALRFFGCLSCCLFVVADVIPYLQYPQLYRAL